jgi:ParB family transcriptional regulator, chromosome partitioning protein
MRLELGELDLRYAELRIRDAARERRLVGSLLEHGQQTPVLVVRDGPAWVLIDGYVRVAALHELARDMVDAAAMEVPEVEALVLGHGLDHRRVRTALEEGWLLRELCERHGMRQQELARRLDRSTSWVSRRLSLVSTLPESVQDVVRSGKLAVQAATKLLVPLARANRTDCEALVRGLGGERVSVRQVERLYVAWKRGDAEQRARLCAEPRLYLRALEADAQQTPEPEDDEQAATMRDLSMLASVCLRVCRRVTEGGEPVGERARAQRHAAWRRADRCFAALRSHFEREETTDARPGHPNGDLATGHRGARRANDRQDPGHLPRSGEERPA